MSSHITLGHEFAVPELPRRRAPGLFDKAEDERVASVKTGKERQAKH